MKHFTLLARESFPIDKNLIRKVISSSSSQPASMNKTWFISKGIMLGTKKKPSEISFPLVLSTTRLRERDLKSRSINVFTCSISQRFLLFLFYAVFSVIRRRPFCVFWYWKEIRKKMEKVSLNRPSIEQTLLLDTLDLDAGSSLACPPMTSSLKHFEWIIFLYTFTCIFRLFPSSKKS